MKFTKLIDELLKEELTQELNNKFNEIEKILYNNKIIAKYIVKVMPFSYKNKKALNIMLSNKYRKSKRRSEIENLIKDLSNKYGKLIHNKDDLVFKIIFKEQ